jgi:hypothetical protein
MLLFATFVLIASGHGVYAIASFVGAVVLSLAFPYFVSEGADPQPRTKESNLRMLGSAAIWAILMVFFLPAREFTGMARRILTSGDLWDWRWITPVAVWAAYSAHCNLKRAAAVTDNAIFNYFNNSTPCPSATK